MHLDDAVLNKENSSLHKYSGFTEKDVVPLPGLCYSLKVIKKKHNSAEAC